MRPPWKRIECYSATSIPRPSGISSGEGEIWCATVGHTLAVGELGANRRRSVVPEKGIVNLSSNDYLRLSRDPAIMSAATAAVERFGVGSTASRGSTQNVELHDQVLYSTLQSPPIVAACIAALDILETDSTRIGRLWSNTKYFKAALRRLGFDIGFSGAPIAPIYLGGDETARRFSGGRARLRAIVTGDHTPEQLDRSICAVETIGRELVERPS